MMTLKILCLILSVWVGPILADLPVHCVGDDVFGEWVLYLGPSGYTNSVSCGHKLPDDPRENWENKPHPYKVMRLYHVTLYSNNTADDEYGNQGTWTMIYDEGWEVRIGHRSFFAFSKFVPKHRPGGDNFGFGQHEDAGSTENYNSICYETVDGWYHFNNGTDWGCYFAEKVHKDEDSPGAEVSSDDIMGPTGPALLEIGSTGTDDADQGVDGAASFLSLSTTTRSSASAEAAFKAAFKGEAHRVVQHINNPNTNATWSARHYDEYDGISFMELGHMLGASTSSASSASKHIHGVKAVPDNRADHEKYAGLPESWDWRDVNGVNFVPRGRKQGSCGSCYAIAATQMMEARINIKTQNRVPVKLSPQSILSCSIYSQGCDGGFPYLVGKYAQDFGILEEKCLAYHPKQAQCSWRCNDPVVHYAENYSYIGGAYGKCGEVHMMRELYKNGPFIVGFNAPQDLFWFNGGIYQPENERDTSEFLEMESSSRYRHPKAFFEKTNHAVLAVGWGVENGLKYWIVQNTWGEDWGEAGYFRIERGRDVCAFEAMSVAFDPIVNEAGVDYSNIGGADDFVADGGVQAGGGGTGGSHLALMPEGGPLVQRAQVIAGSTSNLEMGETMTPVSTRPLGQHGKGTKTTHASVQQEREAAETAEDKQGIAALGDDEEENDDAEGDVARTGGEQALVGVEASRSGVHEGKRPQMGNKVVGGVPHHHHHHHHHRHHDENQ